MFRNLFNPEGGLMITMNQITDCIFLSIFWLMGCIPVITVGASFAALYDASFRGLRKGEKHAWGRFWKVYKENWKGAIVPSLVVIAVCYGVLKGVITLWNGAVYGQISWGLFAGGSFLAVFVMGILSVVFPMISRFENSFPVLMKNSFFLAMANLPRTLVLGILNAGSGFLCAVFVVPVFFLPSLAALLGSLLIEPMFQPYMPTDKS